jgi:5-(carboxyamino)imidazole ribonucleotide synthase
MGYDGKGQRLLRTLADLPDAWAELGNVPLILEQFVEFDREVSLVGVRNRHNEIRFYPLTENEHRNGILFVSRARSGDTLQSEAEDYVSRLMNHLDYVGILAFEFFQQSDTLLANEFAPRVHNSTHWTIEGAETSQFENHLRAVADLPLGSTRQLGPCAMVNLVGQLPPREQVLAVDGAHLHDYGKAPREGRKVGHATVRAESEAALDRSLEQLLAVVSQAEPGN